MPRTEARLVSPQEAAKRLGLSIDTIYRYTKNGRLPVIRIGPRLVRIREADLEGAMTRGLR